MVKPQFILIYKDIDGHFLDINEYGLNIFKLTNDMSIKGKKASELNWEYQYRPFFILLEKLEQAATTSNEIIKEEMQVSFLSQTFEISIIPILSKKQVLIIGTPTLIDDKSLIFTTLFDQAHEGIYITTSDGTILSANNAFTKITGYTISEVVGKKPNLLKSGVHKQAFYRSMWLSIKREGFWDGLIWNKKKSGELYRQSLSIKSIRDKENRKTLFVAIMTDVTKKEEIAKDVELAGQIQREFLPSEIENSYLSLKTIYKPSDIVSGDFFDYKWDEKQNALFGYLFDVMGHGVLTAFQTSALRVLFLQSYQQGLTIKEQLFWINNEAIRYFRDETFGAAMCFKLDFTTNQLTIASSGINKFIRISNQKTEIIKVPGIYLGILENVDYEEHSYKINKGDSFFFMSDGIVDEINEESINGCEDFKGFYHLISALTLNSLKDDATMIGINIK